MEQKKTLFNYLYEDIVKQIKSGKLAYGERLRSYRALCDVYNVGIRTVRDVVKKLIKDGYIKSVARSHIEVAYKEDSDSGNIEIIRGVLSKRDAITGLMKTMSYLLPYAYTEASMLVDKQLIDASRKDIRGLDHMNTKQQWRVSSTALQRIISVFHNSLFRDLYIDVDLFSQVTVIDGFENPFSRMTVNAEQGLNELFDQFLYQDMAGIRHMISKMYLDASQAVSAYFDEVSKRYTGIMAIQEDYHWNAEKGRINRYMEIARDLVEKIGHGVYPDGTYLPSNLVLQEEYSVAALTLINALDALTVAGLVEKQSQRGKYLVTAAKAHTKELLIRNGAPKNDSATLLGAIHAAALLCRGITYAGFDFLTESDADELEQEINDTETIRPANCILRKLVMAQPLKPLQDIYSQLEHLMNWGYYFDFARKYEANLETVTAKTKIAVGYIRSGDKEALADMLRDIYGSNFRNMQAALIRLGMPEAAQMKLP